MPIRDNRILIDAADATTNFIDDTGGTMSIAAGASNIEGSGAIEQQVSAARAGTFYDAGANQDWSDNVFYIWWNVTTANLLATIGSLGVTMRFASGATPNANYFEVAIAGSDVYSGGYTMSVVDIELARELALSSPTNNNAATGGTPPATSAIQYVGIMWDIGGMIPGTDPNCFLDALWRLPVGQPGIIVSGENTGASPNPKPWNWDDIVDAGDIADTAKAWGTIEKADGVIKLNTPIQFGASGSPNTDHDFEDALAVVAWKSELVEDSFYGMSFVGDGVNTQRWQMGVSGSAGQGLTMLAATDGPRWFIDASDANLDAVNFFGCSLSHSAVIDIDQRNVSMYDSLLIDGRRLYHSSTASPRSGADFQRNSVISADPITGFVSPVVSPEDDRSYLATSDPDKIRNCSFLFSDGHAINLLDSGTYDFVGNIFTGYGADDTVDAALHYEQPPAGTYSEDATVISDALALTSTRNVVGQVVAVLGTFNIYKAQVTVQRSSASPEATGSLLAHFEVTTGLVTPYGPPDGVVVEAALNTVDVSTIPVGVPTVIEFAFTGSYSWDSSASPFQQAVLVLSHPEAADDQQVEVMGDATGVASDRNWVLGQYGSPITWDTESPSRSGDIAYTLFDEPAPPDVTLNISDAETPTKHDIGGEIIINNNVNVTITNIQPGTEIRVYPSQDFNSPVDLTEIAGIEDTASPSEFTFSAAAGQIVDIVILNTDYVLPPANRIRNFTVPATSTSFPISQIIDRNFSNP